jgi:hypothetical protein
LDIADLELNPRTPGQLRIETLPASLWRYVVESFLVRPSYTNKNLILRDLYLSDQEQLHFLQIDASQIDANYLAVISTAPSAAAKYRPLLGN